MTEAEEILNRLVSIEVRLTFIERRLDSDMEHMQQMNILGKKANEMQEEANRRMREMLDKM